MYKFHVSRSRLQSTIEVVRRKEASFGWRKNKKESFGVIRVIRLIEHLDSECRFCVKVYVFLQRISRRFGNLCNMGQK